MSSNENPSGPSGSSSSNRQDLIQNAVLFLNDPKVQQSTFTSKISFLESKGLNETEIQEALSRASSGSGSGPGSGNAEASSSSRPFAQPGSGGYAYTSGYDGRYGGGGYGVMTHPPEPPRRDWRDIFIMAVISGGVMYGVTALARKYLLPHLQPPSTTSFQQTSQQLLDSYDEAAKLVSDLSEQTDKLQKSMEDDRERMKKVVDEVEDAVRGVRDQEERWREEMRDVRGEVETVKELVPRMMEQHASNQASALSDLQTELRSLKTLLQSRHLNSHPSSSPSQLNDTSGDSIAKGEQNGDGNGSVSTKGMSSTQVAANALLASKGKARGIPAWQLAPSTGSSGAASVEQSENELERKKGDTAAMQDGYSVGDVSGTSSVSP